MDGLLPACFMQTSLDCPVVHFTVKFLLGGVENQTHAWTSASMHKLCRLALDQDRFAKMIRGRTSLGSDCTANKAEAGDDHHFSQELHLCNG